MEKKLKYEQEERIRYLQEKMRVEFANQQRVVEQQHYDQMMQREREMQFRFDDERRRLETDCEIRVKTIEDRTREMIRSNNDRVNQEDDYRRREQEDHLRRKIQEEKQTIETEFLDHRSRLERQIQAERGHERQMMETMKREKALAEDRAQTEANRARVLEQELEEAR